MLGGTRVFAIDEKTTAELANLAEEFDTLGSGAAPSGFGSRLYKHRSAIATALRLLHVVRYTNDEEAREIGQMSGSPASIHGFSSDGRAVCKAILELAEERRPTVFEQARST
jgi:hypothetical protein